MQDALAEERRRLPWTAVDKPYEFQSPAGRESLAELFDGRSQLFVYHFMFGPDWQEGCRSCSMAADHLDRAVVHLAQRDVTTILASRGPVDKIDAFRQRMGWSLKWVSTSGGDFNFDFGVAYTKEQIEAATPAYNYGTIPPYAQDVHGASVFYRDGDTIYHTYSAYARGVERLLLPYFVLDLVPKGRDEDGLPMPMAWFRHHDRYGAGSAHSEVSV